MVVRSRYVSRHSGVVLRLAALAAGAAALLALPPARAREATGCPTVDSVVAQSQAVPVAGGPYRVRRRHLGPAAPTPIPTPPPDLGVIETTNMVFTNVLPLVGGSLPSVETFVSTALASGLDPLLAGLAAEDPDTRSTIPGGIALDFGTGTEEALGTLAGGITATYSDFLTAGDSLSFNGAIATTDLTINGLAYPITDGTTTVNATHRPADDTVTMDITLSGTGPGGATTSGTVRVDTAQCKKYPIGGSITTAKGGKSARLTFNDNCNGTFGFSLVGGRDFRFDPAYNNCYNYGGSWYNWGTMWLVSENGRLAVDNSDDEPVNVALSGSVTDTEVHITFNSVCRTATCATDRKVYGTFDGHFWKEEPTPWSYRLRYYVGTLTTTFVKYNADGTVFCEDTRVIGDQEGMDGWYEFYEVAWGN
jgi:hypothetical protein